MIVVRSLSSVKHDAHSVVSVGTFDGMHRGHQVIFSKVIDRARYLKGRSVTVTFDPHPRTVIGKEPVTLLMTLKERIDIMKEIGIDLVYVINFTPEFAQLSAREFYTKHIINGTGAQEVIVGHDHMFGRDRKAGVDELSIMSGEFGFGLVIVDPVYQGENRISSSKIRHFLDAGNVELAEMYLARPYSLEGIVVEGGKRGQTLGFPTANIEPLHKEKIVPASGVYCVKIDIEGIMRYGMLNIGVRPTFYNSPEKVIEVNIFGITDILYGKILKISFLCRLRDEKKFSSPAELVNQLMQDKDKCQIIINEKYKT
jgi:riboflavin kinase / FMN adenylyltransferase